MTITVSSREHGIFGSRLSVNIEAEDIGNGELQIGMDEWNRTLGPIFERTAASVLADKRREVNQDTPLDVINGYNAMTTAQTRQFHTLMQCFAAARDKDGMAYVGGDYASRLRRFAEAYKGGHVVVSRDQLEGLTAIAREAAEFAREDDKYNKVDAFSDQHVHANPAMRYRHGIINAFT